jgi:beta-galactosidase
LFDRDDFPKPDALEHESWWSAQPIVHIVRRVAPTPKAPTDPGYELEQYRPKPTVFADWTPESAAPHVEHVEVYSNCAEVTLSLNGKTLGHKPLVADLSPRAWAIEFEPGELVAQCGDAAGTKEILRTAEEPAAIQLIAETKHLGSGFDEVAMVRAIVVDAHGTPVPSAAVPLHFQVEGPAALVATDNADNLYSGPFTADTRPSHEGRGVAFLRGNAPSGTVHVLASSPGLKQASLELQVSPQRP